MPKTKLWRLGVVAACLLAAGTPRAMARDDAADAAATRSERTKLVALTGLPVDRELELYAQFCATADLKGGDSGKAPFGLTDEERSKRNLYRFKWLDQGKEGATARVGVGVGTLEDFNRSIGESKQKGNFDGWEHVGVGLTEPNGDGQRACQIVVGKRQDTDAAALKTERDALKGSADVGDLASPGEQRARFLEVVNRARATVGYRAKNQKAQGHPKEALPPMAYDDRLNAGAQHQAEMLKWMAGTQLMSDIGNSHNGLPFVGHFEMGDRLRRVMPNDQGSAEAISMASGTNDPVEAHARGLMSNETHFRPFFDLQNSDDAGFDTSKALRFTVLGYGYVIDGKGQHWGVALFAKDASN
jgi:hypothetical protein